VAEIVGSVAPATRHPAPPVRDSEVVAEVEESDLVIETIPEDSTLP
jgi:hypothetical protein